MKIREEVGLSFDDVLMVPQRGKVKSRNDVDLSTHLGGNCWLSSPIVASPMSTVCEARLARRLSEIGGIGIIHRFMTVKDQVDNYVEATKSVGLDGDVYKPPTHWAAVAVGVAETKPYERLQSLFEVGARIFCIDVAHGHSNLVSKFMDKLPKDIAHHGTFISGSVATADGARFSVEAGFDTIRVGIGNGAACSTRATTGHGVPQLTALMEISEEIKGDKSKNGMPVRIISCGGIRTGSDAVKALAAGASTILLGSYLAGCNESPDPGIYRGEASKSAQKAAGKEVQFIEGESGTVNKTGSLEATLAPLLNGIRSGISYSGAASITELQEKAEFITIAPGVQNESSVRI